MPELIDSSNLLRKNEFLVSTDQKKTELLSLYSTYVKIYGIIVEFFV